MSEERRAATRAQILFHQEYLANVEGRSVVEFPKAARVAMIGPHPDDIVLGCGGTAIKYAKAKVPVHFICLTDGRACVADPAERERLVTVRAEEERRAGKICNVSDVRLLGIPEDEFASPARLAEWTSRLGEALQAIAPDAIFIPYWFEMHPWHRYANYLLKETLQKISVEATVYAYEVLSLVPPSHVVDISEVYGQKADAVRAYASQMAMRDYVKDMTLIGRLHAPLAGEGAQVAEVFQAYSKAEYVERVEGLAVEEDNTLGVGIQPVIPEAS